MDTSTVLQAVISDICQDMRTVGECLYSMRKETEGGSGILDNIIQVTRTCQKSSDWTLTWKPVSMSPSRSGKFVPLFSGL